MEINVGENIAEVLYERDTVTLPGLGAFATNYKVARLDRAAGKWLPPAKELQFDKDQSNNDGVLVRYIKEKHNLSYADAQDVVVEYVDDLKEAIEKEEIVALPNVGRIYKDYTKNLVFLPDKENFAKATFGLPPVQQLAPIRTVNPTSKESSSKLANKKPVGERPILDAPEQTVNTSATMAAI